MPELTDLVEHLLASAGVRRTTPADAADELLVESHLARARELATEHRAEECRAAALDALRGRPSGEQACSALELLAAAVRPDDAAAADHLLRQLAVVAGENGLRSRQLRALADLGLIDLVAGVRRDDDPGVLTGRELAVLHQVRRGLGDAEIAEVLSISPRTVEKHVERLLTKTGAVSRAQLAGRRV